MPRRSPHRLQPDAAFAALAVDAAQAGDQPRAERLARTAERFGRLRLALPKGELHRLGRVRYLERRLDRLELKLRPLLAFLEDALDAEAAALAAPRPSPAAAEACMSPPDDPGDR